MVRSEETRHDRRYPTLISRPSRGVEPDPIK